MKHAIALVVGVALIVPCVASAQSLADMAKKAQEQREAAKKKADEKKPDGTANEPTKVYTNKDVKDAPPATPAQAGAVTTTPQTAAAANAPVPAQSADAAASDDYRQIARHDQEYWKVKMAERQAAIDDDTIRLAAMINRADSLSADFNGSQSVSQRAVIRIEREKALTEVTRLKAAVASDKKAIATLEEEARRAGVPPGWLRPGGL